MSKKSLEELFWIVIDGWAYGIKQYPGEIYPELVYRVVRELRTDIQLAIQCNILVDVMLITEKFSAAAKYLVPEKELAFNILAQLPCPSELKTEDQLYTLAQTVDRVEQMYPGAVVSRLEKKWQLNQAQAA
ncbi:MAG: hypothetical protein SGJ02_01580 [bacterium]|nr:hypothetical protein [bacterium]